METLYQFLDYREFLRQHYEARKVENKNYSYRVFASAVGMDQSHLAKILLGHMHLPLEKVSPFCEYFEFKNASAKYFEALVCFGRASTPAEAKTWFDQLQIIRPPKFRCLPAEQHEYFRHWYTPVIRALVGIQEHSSATKISEQIIPPITPEAAQQSIDLLRSLDLIRQTSEGEVLSEAHIGSGRVPNSPLLRNYHHQILERSMDALENIPIEERDISSLTVSLDEQAFADIRAMIRDFRTAVQKRVDLVDKAERAYLINFQIFPVSHKD